MNRQPTLAELTQRFLAQPVAADAGGGVEPYDVPSAFRVEPRTAWQETLEVLKALGVRGPLPPMPAEWPSQVRQQSPAKFLPMALGHYPQQVSDLSRLLKKDATTVIDTAGASKAIAALEKAAGDDSAMKTNEAAVRLWYAGKVSEAIALWNFLPESAVKAFNMGVAHFALGEAALAIPQLKRASELLYEGSGWKALADLYRALAESED